MITAVKDDNMDANKQEDKQKQGSRRKKLIFIGTLAIAVIFLTSIASFSFNSNNNTSTTTSVLNVQTLLALGYTNATVAGYASKFTIFVPNSSSNATESDLSNILIKLSDNGSVSDYIPAGNSFIVYAANMSTYGIYQYVNAHLSANETVGINATVKAQLPGSVILYSNGQGLPTNLPAGASYSFSSNSPQSTGTLVPVEIQAYVYQNKTGFSTYSVYNNNLVVYPR